MDLQTSLLYPFEYIFSDGAECTHNRAAGYVNVTTISDID